MAFDLPRWMDAVLVSAMTVPNCVEVTGFDTALLVASGIIEDDYLEADIQWLMREIEDELGWDES